MIADFLVHYTGLYERSPYWNVPIEFVCRVGHALGFVWVFVFSGNAKEHLRQRFPKSLGRLFDRFGGTNKLDRMRNATMATNSSTAGANVSTAM